MWLEGQKYFQATLKEEPIYNVQIEILNKTKKWLDCYFNGEKPNINRLLLKPQGSKFRKEIWKILCENIPATYVFEKPKDLLRIV